MSKLIDFPEFVHDELEGQMFLGKKLETFRNNKTGSISVRGGENGGFTVVINESGEVVVQYESRAVRLKPWSNAAIESHTDDIPPRSSEIRRRGAR